MNEPLLTIFHEGFTYGLLAGVLLCIAVQVAAREHGQWRRQMAAERARALRCPIAPECVLDRGHREPCDLVEYE